MAQPDLFRLPTKPWNAGRLICSKTPLKPKRIRAIQRQLKASHEVRDLAMFNYALDANLRGCDLVKLRIRDVAIGAMVRQRSTTALATVPSVRKVEKITEPMKASVSKRRQYSVGFRAP